MIISIKNSEAFEAIIKFTVLFFLFYIRKYLEW